MNYIIPPDDETEYLLAQAETIREYMSVKLANAMPVGTVAEFFHFDSGNPIVFPPTTPRQIKP